MSSPFPRGNRRQFLRAGGALAAAGSTLPSALGATLRADSKETLSVGLVGCGGRGGGAAVNALRADPNVKLVALGDAFPDFLTAKLGSLKAIGDIADRIDVPEDRQFVGFDAYKGVIDSCDVVLLATSPHFRPLHVEYAVEHGVHAFVEKPIATDAVGVRRVWAASEKAREKGLSISSGLCYRYQFAKQETFKRVHDGMIGDITALECTYNTGGLWHRGRKAEWSEMEYQMRNWLYFTWLSGDHIAEQHIHSLDKLAWAMQDDYPVKCTASGGRIVRTDEQWGNIYDHFNTVYEWGNGVKGFSSCRQWVGADANVSDFAYGTKGTAALQSHRINTEGEKWRYRGEGPDDMYQNEHDALFAALRGGERIDNADYMCKSTMMAIMARMSAYTGKTVTWDQAWNSELDLSPAAYEWGDVPMRPVAQPGITPFV
ncbi:MAG: Gfo/Idh/MocA family oxidoreductase [Planctomycetes bacterium]|nr:Gfo/Idh/MocA family oxidoreductase [Planctomycetota bacterium]MDA0947474.1 Gfo/Idh/MocA family oxidoreductase [Planctomycetota bacterium]